MKESRPLSISSKSPQETTVMPVDVMRGVLSSFLDIKDIANLASTHRYLYDEMKQSEYKKTEIWKEILMFKAFGIRRDIDELKKVFVAIDYQKLFHDYCKSPIEINNKDKLLALVGAPDAIKEISKESIGCRLSVDCNFREDDSFSRLYEITNLVALSGSIDGLDALCQRAENDLIITASKKSGENSLYYAVRSRSPNMLKKVADLKNKHGHRINLFHQNDAGETLLFFAVKNGFVSMVDAILSLENEEGLTLSIFEKNKKGETLLYAAVESGSPVMLDKVLSLRGKNKKSLDVLTKRYDGATLLHKAIECRSLAMFEKILSLKNGKGECVNFLDRTEDGQTLLHMAVYYDSIDLLDRALSLRTDKGERIDVMATSDHQGDLLYMLRYSLSLNLKKRIFFLRNDKGELYFCPFDNSSRKPVADKFLDCSCSDVPHRLQSLADNIKLLRVLAVLWKSDYMTNLSDYKRNQMRSLCKIYPSIHEAWVTPLEQLSKEYCTDHEKKECTPTLTILKKNSTTQNFLFSVPLKMKQSEKVKDNSNHSEQKEMDQQGLINVSKPFSRNSSAS